MNYYFNWLEETSLNQQLKADVVVIGAGPGGYRAAVTAAQSGGKVVLIEREKIGGLCVNKGCIPTKALQEYLKELTAIQKFRQFGLDTALVPSFALLKRRVNNVIEGIVEDMIHAINLYAVKMLKGSGTLVKQGLVEVIEEKGSRERIECKSVVIATGSKPMKPHYVKGETISPDELLNMEETPESIAVIGSDYEAVEIAQIFNNFGSKATVITRQSQFLESEDHEIVAYLQDILMESGIEVVMNAHEIHKKDDEVYIETSERSIKVKAETALITERKPNIDELNLKAVGIEVSEGKILVNERMETTVEGIYAVGDAIGGKYAHTAFSEGIVAGNNSMGREASIDHSVIPSCIWTNPSIARVGLTENEARGRGYDIKIAKLPFSTSGKARIMGEGGFVKVIADKRHNEILGVHIIGPDACELIAEAALALKIEATVEEIADLMHPHPTLSEVFREASLILKS